MELEEQLSQAQQQLDLQQEQLGYTREFTFSQDMEPEVDEYGRILDTRTPNITRRALGTCKRLQRWFNRQSVYLSRRLRMYPRMRNIALLYVILLHALLIACMFGLL
ncbi:uncharacterized protein LOC112042130 [Lingula anatina]|nr:uncharacterized protein LOC112042130 [Lingula anatina]|eukprot:XP_023931879.1 uncharacterized protein LOC112042130 [Lingula anatina]